MVISQVVRKLPVVTVAKVVVVVVALTIVVSSSRRVVSRVVVGVVGMGITVVVVAESMIAIVRKTFPKMDIPDTFLRL